MKQCVISIEEFNIGFSSAVLSDKSPYPVEIDENVKLHYLNVDDKLKLVNANGDWQRMMFSKLGFALAITSPKLFNDGLKGRLKGSRLFKYISNG